ncbi:hypothetical protein KDL45_00175 [bacterium]|nr:hypothetical protein [bacterium]
MRWRTAIAIAFFGVFASGLARLSDSRYHLWRLEDRGQGITQLAADKDQLAGIGLYSRRAWIFDRPTGAFRVETVPDPSHDIVPVPATGGGMIVIPYLSGQALYFPADGSRVRVLDLSMADVPSPGYAVGDLIRGRDDWYAAAYGIAADGTVKKEFPQFAPGYLNFPYALLKVGEFDAQRIALRDAWFQGTSRWHEESFHPWKLALTEDERALVVLNTMGETLAVHDTRDAELRFEAAAPSGPIDLLVFDGEAAVAAPESPYVHLFDLNSGEESGRIPTGRGVVALARDDRGHVLALSKYRRALVVASRSRHGVWATREIALPGTPASLVWWQGMAIVADSVDGSVRRVDVDAGTVGEAVPFMDLANGDPWRDAS